MGNGRPDVEYDEQRDVQPHGSAMSNSISNQMPNAMANSMPNSISNPMMSNSLGNLGSMGLQGMSNLSNMGNLLQLGGRMPGLPCMDGGNGPWRRNGSPGLPRSISGDGLGGSMSDIGDMGYGVHVRWNGRYGRWWDG